MRALTNVCGLVLLAILVSGPSARAASPGNESLVYYLPFDGSTAATSSPDGQPQPLVARGLRFVPGIRGQAVYVGPSSQGKGAPAPFLEYDAGKLFASPAGTVSFWVSPNWDGYISDPIHFPWHFLLNIVGGPANANFPSFGATPPQDRLFTLFMWNWLRGDVLQKNGKAVSLQWRCRASWMRQDWWYIALTWNGNQEQLYLDGIPQYAQIDHVLPESRRFIIGGYGGSWADAAFDEFKIYNRALSQQEIRDQFRAVAPVNFIVERRYLRADTPEQVTLEVDPAQGVPTPIHSELQMRVLADAGGRTIAQRTLQLSLQQDESFSVPVGSLPVGDYRLECVLQGPQGRYQRGYALTVYQPEPAAAVSSSPVELGQRIAHIDCTDPGFKIYESGQSRVCNVPGVGRYRQAGDRVPDRFAFEVPTPGADGSPMMLKITWPDDRERSMGLYMYPPSKTKQPRDRLAGGIQSGGEYPISNKMQTASYLFYPAANSYLFEARTMVTGLPAAVSTVDVYRLAQRLPKLPITMPTGLPQRCLGDLDEDQSFPLLLAPYPDPNFQKSPLRWGYPIQALERLMDYFDYTGQNELTYSLARYNFTYYDQGPLNPPLDELPAILPPGGVDLMLDMFQQRHMHLLGGIDLYGAPLPHAAAGLPLTVAPGDFARRVQEGYFQLDRHGQPEGVRGFAEKLLGNNPLYPAVRARLLGIVRTILQRYGHHPAFKGIDIWCYHDASPFIFNSLDYGYDDYTVGLFEKETGIQVPPGASPADRFESRYQFLTGPQRSAWIRWRAQKTTELFQEIDRMVRATRPDLQLLVSPAHWIIFNSPVDLARSQYEQFDFNQYCLDHLSLDLPALKKLPSVVLDPQPNITAYRWIKHWFGQESVLRELDTNFEKFRAFRNGARSAMGMFLIYFESFNNSLKPDPYNSYFQNADVKAHDRFFLEDYALAMAGVDPSTLAVGAQPLGSSGRDAEVREFAQAYRALPAGDFHDVAGLRDPITVRALQTPQGTYLYAVNLVWLPVRVALGLEGGQVTVTDLSTGQALSPPGPQMVVDLKPFQLRSFLLKGPLDLGKMTGRLEIPPATRGWYTQQVADLSGTIAGLAKSGADVAQQQGRLAAMQDALAHQAYAEVQRLLFSKMMRLLGPMKEYAAAGYFQTMKAMLARSEYAVDCGSSQFYKAKSGQLYFPDQPYKPGGYGHVGSYQCVGRSVVGLQGSQDPELFATEAYDLDGYRFTVRNGRYTVRLSFKVGYRPNARPGLKFNVAIDNKPVLTDFDVFQAAGDNFNRVVVREFKNIQVTNGRLDIDFSVPGDNTTIKLCDAIEVLPQP